MSVLQVRPPVSWGAPKKKPSAPPDGEPAAKKQTSVISISSDDDDDDVTSVRKPDEAGPSGPVPKELGDPDAAPKEPDGPTAEPVGGFSNMDAPPPPRYLKNSSRPLVDERYNRTTYGLAHKDKNFKDVDVDAMNFVAGYARVNRHWGLEEGIREFLQNWQDGALRTAQTIHKSRPIKHSDLISITETKTEKLKTMVRTIVKTTLYVNGDPSVRDTWVDPVYAVAWLKREHVTDPNTPEDQKEESLTMTNAGVTLSKLVLRFGYSDKPAGSSGGFGEGMKLGISSVLDNCMNVQMRTGGKVWSFYATNDTARDVHMTESIDPNGKNLLNTIVTITTKHLVGLKDQTECTLPVGEFRKCVDEVFPKWFLYFRPPSPDVVYTKDGALLLADSDLHYIYVKGIMVMKYEHLNKAKA